MAVAAAVVKVAMLAVIMLKVTRVMTLRHQW